MDAYYESRETQPAPARERQLFTRLPAFLAQARDRAPALARALEGIDLDQLTDRAALARIPVLRKSALLQAQHQRHAPAPDTDADDARERIFGGYSAIGWGEARRVFSSPGPIYEPEGGRSDYWGFARALYAAGARPGMLVHNCFSYHFTPAGAMLETAAHALGCTVFPGGVGQTEQQVRAMADLAPDVYVGTPSFLRIILEKADHMGLSLPRLRYALCSGEAFPPDLVGWLAQRGIAGFQAYGSADLGLIAYESQAKEGMILNEDLILEIVRPGSDQPVPAGEVGEVVVTRLNPDYPLLRFGTGDLSALMPGISPCGRTNDRIRGWMGRADQSAKVRGLFIHPEQIAQVLVHQPQILKARVVISSENGADHMLLKAEADTPLDLDAVATTIREHTKLRADVQAVPPNTLPNDGRIIEDTRLM